MSEREVMDRHEAGYARSHAEVLVAMERQVLDSDYQANGYTTRAQADHLGRLLELGPGDLLLDVGAGCGWPGLYLADRLGCSVVTIDPTTTGMQAARRRAGADGLASRADAVTADAVNLPLRPSSVDAIVHTDVLC